MVYVNQASLLENDTYKLRWDIQTDYLILDSRADITIINNNKKENLQNCRFAVPADHRIKLKEFQRKDKYLELARELKKLWNMKVPIIPIVIGAFGIVNKELFGSWRTSRDYPKYCIVENGQIKKSPRDLRKLAVIKTPVKDHLLKLM